MNSNRSRRSSPIIWESESWRSMRASQGGRYQI